VVERVRALIITKDACSVNKSYTSEWTSSEATRMTFTRSRPRNLPLVTVMTKDRFKMMGFTLYLGYGVRCIKMDALLQKLDNFDKPLSKLRMDGRCSFKNPELKRTNFGLTAVAYIDDFHVMLPHR
jgi:hypothetical protein